MKTDLKMIFALMQIENISQLIEGMDYESYMNSHLLKIKTELKRQLTNFEHTAKVNK
jgi:hypothetical protein